MRLWPWIVALAGAVGFAAAGCGGDNEKEAEGDEGARITCRADAFDGDPGLPTNFPTPGEFTVTESTLEGPTRVVVGYWESRLEEAYREWQEKVEEAGFNVTFDELEDRDSEVTYVRITSRPE